MPVEFISATHITPAGNAQGHNLAGFDPEYRRGKKPTWFSTARRRHSRARPPATPRTRSSARTQPNVGAVRLRAVADKGELHDRCLWTPPAKELAGQGSTTALVGSYETVAAALMDYAEIGCDLLSIRGRDVFNDAQDYARHVLPLVRPELAHRQATGRAPVLNPDSKPTAEPKLALA